MWCLDRNRGQPPKIGEKREEKVPEERQLIKIEEVSLERMSLEQKRRAEQLYNQLGLDPVVDKV